MELLPELAEEKTADDALKVLKKLEEDALTHELRARQDARHLAEGHADPNVVHTQLDQGIKTILHLAKNNYCVGDAFTGMQSLRTDGAIDIIECDPPYGIELNEQKGSKQSAVSTVHTYEEIDAVAYPSFLDRLATELFRVAGKDSWLVFWFGPSWHNQVLTSLRKAGWHVDEIPAIWAKNQGQTIQPEIYMARGYEPFFLCRKGKPILHQRGRLNVFNFAGVPGKTKYHPTQRPIDLIKEVLGTLGGGLRQRVFVPFLGSGATLLACYDLGYQGFGYDLNGEYKDKFLLEAEARTRKLFDEAEQE
jgi:DNA modification methylase